MGEPVPDIAAPVSVVNAAQPDLSTLVITLLKGVLHREGDERLWSSLLNLQPRVRDYVRVLGLDLVLDEAEGYAFLKGRPEPRPNASSMTTKRNERVLDERLRLISGSAFPDITLDSDSFASLDMPVRHVFITENETNFLAFPTAREAIVIFGAGYGWDAMAKARWLARCAVHYWGDIDTHGFAILDQLRSRLQHVSSFLMDRDTLNAHDMHWGEEPDQVLHDLPRLSSEERALFDDLRDNRIRKNLRLEQERLGFQWVTDALSRVMTSNRTSYPARSA
jgi:hypothetical protein